jgi:dihydroneopterin triphosphate diphosphatase
MRRLVDCFVVRNRGDYEVLLLRRARGRIYAGAWRMVGGKVESGERAFQAALRELKEETGLFPERLWSVPFVNQFFDWQSDQVHDIPVFLAQVAPRSEVTLDSEHDGFRWIGLDEALGLLEWPGQRKGLEAAQNLLGASEEFRTALEIPLLEK